MPCSHCSISSASFSRLSIVALILSNTGYPGNLISISESNDCNDSISHLRNLGAMITSLTVFMRRVYHLGGKVLKFLRIYGRLSPSHVAFMHTYPLCRGGDTHAVPALSLSACCSVCSLCIISSLLSHVIIRASACNTVSLRLPSCISCVLSDVTGFPCYRFGNGTEGIPFCRFVLIISIYASIFPYAVPPACLLLCFFQLPQIRVCVSIIPFKRSAYSQCCIFLRVRCFLLISCHTCRIPFLFMPSAFAVARLGSDLWVIVLKSFSHRITACLIYPINSISSGSSDI